MTLKVSEEHCKDFEQIFEQKDWQFTEQYGVEQYLHSILPSAALSAGKHCWVVWPFKMTYLMTHLQA